MDSCEFRDDLVHQLGYGGFDVTVTSDSNYALNIIHKCYFDSVITQLYLPQFDGLELILNLQDMKISIPIIAISFEDSIMKTETLMAGATYFFQYPIKPDIIIDVLKQSQHNILNKNKEVY
jgi:DNA-binding response OmpR family regulator